MKKIFQLLFATILSLAAFAQYPTVSIDVQYRIDAQDSTKKNSTFFISRFSHSFSISDKEMLMNIAASRVLKMTAAGDSVPNYEPFYITPVFNPDIAIADCAKYRAEMFQVSSCTLGSDLFWPNHAATYLLKKGNDAVSPNLTILQNKKYVVSVDTAWQKNKGKKVAVLSYNYLQPKDASISFIENWNFDPLKGHFEKTIKYYGFYEPRYRDGEFSGYAPVLYLSNRRAVTGASAAQQTLLKSNVVCDVAVNWPERMLSEDSSTQHYDRLDAVCFLNLQDGNIPQGERSKLLTSIFSYALKNPRKVFPVNGSVVDSLHPFKRVGQIDSIFANIDTVEYENVNINHSEVNTVIEWKTLGDVYAIRFYEDWYYDPNDFTVKKIVRGLGILLFDHDRQGNPIITDSEIYIKMN